MPASRKQSPRAVQCILCELYLIDHGSLGKAVQCNNLDSETMVEKEKWTALSERHEHLAASIWERKISLLHLASARASMNFEMFQLFREIGNEMIRFLAVIASRDMRARMSKEELSRIDSMAERYVFRR